jgi:hypothetical protein
MLVVLSEVLGILVSYLSLYYPCYWDMGRILVIFYVMLSLPSSLAARSLHNDRQAGNNNTFSCIYL